MEDWLSFRKMITPFVVQFIFWIGVLACILAGVIQIYSGINSSTHQLERALVGILTLVGGPLLVRLYCELIVVIFSINSTLTDILNQLKTKAK